MPFGLTNALATFNRLMTDLFQEGLDNFVLVFFDDILIYSKTREEHEQHLRQVLEILRTAKLYTKRSKCLFFVEKVAYLGFIVSKDGISPDPDKDGARTSGQQLRVPEHVLLDEGLAEAVERIWEAALASEEDVASQCAAGISELSCCMHETALARSSSSSLLGRCFERSTEDPASDSEDGARTYGQQLRVPEHVLLDEGLAEAVERIWEAALASEEDVASQCAAGISELSCCMHETALARSSSSSLLGRCFERSTEDPASDSEDGARTYGQQLRVPEHVLLDEGLAEAVERIWEAALASEEDVASQCAAGISELSCCMHETALARRGNAPLRVVKAKQLMKGLWKGLLLYVLKLNKPEKESKDKETEDREPEWLSEFSDVFSKELTDLTPTRELDHNITLVPEAQPIAKSPYKMSLSEALEMKNQLTQLLEQGFIRPSVSLWVASILFQKKRDGTFRLCIDYRGLNQCVIKNKYPLPRIDRLFDHLSGAQYFSKIDLRSRFYQVQIQAEDIPKTAFNTRFGHYEFVVMPFGLTNAHATFNQLMTDLFQEGLDNFVLIFFDDILVYSKTTEEHEQHLHQFLEILKRSKCLFFVEKVAYLGFIVSKEGISPDVAKGISPDVAKVEAVVKWPIPQSVSEVRGFLGLTGWCRIFIQDYALISKPLTELTQIDETFIWTEKRNFAFNKLKNLLSESPVLKLPDFEKTFEVIVDACAKGVGGILRQGHPIAYKS
ncbi:hypothetical protein L7F22_026159 [Adiantum nelumboides]|nr:hypothetical protein [Adiantum nelumboides]